jgi:hypothetical protein
LIHRQNLQRYGRLLATHIAQEQAELERLEG